MSQRRTTQQAKRKAPPIKKPFPVAFAAGSAGLAAVLIGTLVYAASHQGAGDHSGLAYAQRQVSGVVSTAALHKNHVSGSVTYPNQSSTPPVGGDHNSVPQTCQVYTQPIANEHAVHDLEHGAVWLTYNPKKVNAADLTRLRALVAGNDHRLMSPYPGLRSAVSVQAWGEQLFTDNASDKRLATFMKVFTSGPQPQERGALCQGTTSPGPL